MRGPSLTGPKPLGSDRIMPQLSPMDEQALRAIVHQDDPPASGCPLLRAVWHALRGDWDAAHAIAQDDPTASGAWVHAWLHRIEGDLGNAAYWYRRAARPMSAKPTHDEGYEIAAALLRDEPRS
jgi:hypothetical protein